MEKVVTIPKYVDVPTISYREEIIKVPKIEYKDIPVPREVIKYIDVTQTIEHTIEVPEITYEDRTVEKVPSPSSLSCLLEPIAPHHSVTLTLAHPLVTRWSTYGSTSASRSPRPR